MALLALTLNLTSGCSSAGPKSADAGPDNYNPCVCGDHSDGLGRSYLACACSDSPAEELARVACYDDVVGHNCLAFSAGACLPSSDAICGVAKEDAGGDAICWAYEGAAKGEVFLVTTVDLSTGNLCNGIKHLGFWT